MPENDKQEDGLLLLTNFPPTPVQKRFAAAIAVSLFLAMLVAAPYARISLEHTEAFLPAYAGAIMMIEVITAFLLLALFSVQRSWAVFALSAGYLISGLLVVPWAMTFPGAFTQTGLLEAGPQATASIAALRRVGFPLAVLLYALLKDRRVTSRRTDAPLRGTLASGLLAIVAAVAGLSWLILSNQQALPDFMQNARVVSSAWKYVPIAAMLVYVVTLGLLSTRLRSMLDLWLMVVIWTLMIEVLLISFISAGLRLSIGWWAGRLFGMTSASIVLLVLLSETMSLSAKLVRSISAERHAREARLLAMQALSASIAHEVSQPVASMVINAESGLRWLSRHSPNLDETRTALKSVVRDGHRAGEVIKTVRTIFMKEAQRRVALDLNNLIAGELLRREAELRLGEVTIHSALEAPLPLVIGNSVQLQHVLSNLFDNALEAMLPVADRPRMLRVSAALQGPDSILVSVEDTGTGLVAEHRERVFEAFFSTKPTGMGIGLLFCRWVIEAHGGRLWVAESVPGGTTFHFILPCGGSAPVLEAAPPS